MLSVPGPEDDARTPRSVSSVTARAASHDTPEAPIGATHTFSTPSSGAIHASRVPSGEIRGLVRSGLPKRTLRGMRSTMPHAYHTAGAARAKRTAPVYAPNVSGTRTSLTGWLARMGFGDVTRAERQLADLGITADHPLLAALAQAADPALALDGLARIAERSEGLSDALAQDGTFRTRLTAVLGVSKALADHLARHPDDCAVLRGPDAERRPEPAAIRDELLRAVSADPVQPQPKASLDGTRTNPAALLAAAYRRRVLHLAARDLTGVVAVDQVGEELADIADAVLEAALAIARAEASPDAAPCRLAVIAMGKCGARELNYASDVDVIFVAEPADETGQTPEEDALKTARTGSRPALSRSASGPPPRAASSPSTPTCAPKDATARSSARWPATWRTTSGGPRPGSSRRC